MNKNPAEDKGFIHQLSQDELLRKIEHEYTSSAPAPEKIAIDSDKNIEDTAFVPLSIEQSFDPDTEETDSEKNLHFRNRAQVEHTVITEKSAIAHWAK